MDQNNSFSYDIWLIWQKYHCIRIEILSTSSFLVCRKKWVGNKLRFSISLHVPGLYGFSKNLSKIKDCCKKWGKVKIFWEGHKSLKKISSTLFYIISEFFKFSNFVAFLQYLNFNWEKWEDWKKCWEHRRISVCRTLQITKVFRRNAFAYYLTAYLQFGAFEMEYCAKGELTPLEFRPHSNLLLELLLLLWKHIN